MRIIAGKFRGRKLAVPKGLDVRPTADRVKEALFSILGYQVVGATVLDLFAGAGALGLEALSRGAERVVFVEQRPKSIDAIRANLDAVVAADQAGIVRQDLTRGLGLAAGQGPYHLVFLDPPYGQGLLDIVLPHLVGPEILDPDAIVVTEISAKETLVPPDGLEIADTRKYGRTALVFLRPVRLS
jgi:16S rRNA (guanine966-N2)-methyltransferase